MRLLILKALLTMAETERRGGFRKPRRPGKFFHETLRAREIGSVFEAMPGIFPYHLPLACLIMGDPQVAPGITLPTGSDAAFHAPLAEHTMPDVAPPELPKPRPRVAPKPVVLPRISSGFGWRSDPMQGDRRLHAGIDIPGRLGSGVQATAAGTVRSAGWRGGYGYMVEIDHGGGLYSRYGHLSQILVPAGAHVAQGETIARMGSTGRSTGSHLHFELRENGRPVDPRLILTGTPAPRQPEAQPWTAETETHLSDFARARHAGDTGF